MFEPQQAEEYFSTINSPSRRLMQDIHDIRNSDTSASETQDWDTLSDQMKNKILDERLIENLNEYSKPRPQKYHTLDRQSRRRSRDQKMQSTLPNGKTAVRLSTFGVEQVFPRLKIDTGQKEITIEDSSNGFQTDDSSDNVTTYRDEHSAPFNWATKSQQELRFETGTPDYIPSESEVSEQGLETLRTISPKNSTLMIRQSRGNPCYAKPVQIPQVPKMSAKSPTGDSSTLGRKARKPSVSPHRINNFVCETSPNRLILDFGTASNSTENGSENGSDMSGLSTGHNSSTDCSSTRSSVGLLEKMKQKTRKSIKRSISSVSTKNRNKRETSSKGNNAKMDLSNCDPNSKDFINYKYSPTNSSMTLSSISIAQNSMTSLQSNQTLTSSAHKYICSTTRSSRQNSRQSSVISFDKTDSSSNNSQTKEPIYGTTRRSITKPSHAPPPPPVKPPKPSNPPPPLPSSNGNSFGSRFTFDPVDSVPLENAVNDIKESNNVIIDSDATVKDNNETAIPDKESNKYSSSFLNSIPFVKPALKSKMLGSSIKSCQLKEKSQCHKNLSLDHPELEKHHPELKKHPPDREPISLEPNMSFKQYKIDTEEQCPPTTSDCKTDRSIEMKALEDFKVDLSVDVEIPKTGFDFLDNW